MSVRQFTWDKSAPIGRIFIKFDILVFYKNLSRELKLMVIRQEQRVLYWKIYLYIFIS
jgi:hypothetical protein